MGQKDHRDSQRQRDKNKRSAQGRERRQEVSANTEPTETGGYTLSSRERPKKRERQTYKRERPSRVKQGEAP